MGWLAPLANYARPKGVYRVIFRSQPFIRLPEHIQTVGLTLVAVNRKMEAAL